MIDTLKVIGTVGYLGGLPTVLEDFCFAFSALREFTRDYLTGPGEIVHFTRAKVSLHSAARNFLVEEMLGDWLLQLDTDLYFEPDILFKMVRLMHDYHVPVLSGIYRHKAVPHNGMLWMWDEAAKAFAPFEDYDASVPLFRVDATGGGCLLVHRSVFARLKEAFPHEGPFDHIGRFGEDLSFAIRLRKLGIPLHATPLVEVYHLMTRAVTVEDFVSGWYQTEQIAVAVPAKREPASVGEAVQG